MSEQPKNTAMQDLASRRRFRPEPHICAHCRRDYRRKTRQGRYCGDTCRQRAYRERRKRHAQPRSA